MMNLINNLTDKEAMDLLLSSLTAQEWQDFNNMPDADRDEYFKGFKACLDEYIEAGKDKPTPPGGGGGDRDIPDDGLRHWRPRLKKDKLNTGEGNVKDNRLYVDDNNLQSQLKLAQQAALQAQQAALQAQKAALQAQQAANAAQLVAQQAQQNNSPTAQQTLKSADAAMRAARLAQLAAGAALQAAQQAQQAAQQQAQQGSNSSGLQASQQAQQGSNSSGLQGSNSSGLQGSNSSGLQASQQGSNSSGLHGSNSSGLQSLQGSNSSALQAAQQAAQQAQQAVQAAQEAIQNAIDAGKLENKNMDADLAALQAQQSAQQAQQAAQQAQQAAQDAKGTTSELKAQQAAQQAQQAADAALQAALLAQQAAKAGDDSTARQQAQDALKNAQDALQSSQQAQQAAQQGKSSNANAAQQAALQAQQAALQAQQAAESALLNNNNSDGQHDSSVNNALTAAKEAAEHAKQALESAAKAQECAQKGDTKGEEMHSKAAQQAANKALEAANRAESAKRNTEGNKNNEDDRDEATKIDSNLLVHVDINDVCNMPNDLFPDGMDAHEIIKKLAENAGLPLDADDYADPAERAKEIYNAVKNKMPKLNGRGFGNSLLSLADTIEELFKSTINWRATLKKLFNNVAKHYEISVMSKRRMGLDPSHLLHKGRYMHPNTDFEEETDGLMQVFILIDNSGSMQMTTGSGHSIFENIIAEIVDLEVKTNIQNSALAYFSFGEIRKNAIHTWTAKDCKNKKRLIDKVKRNTSDDGNGGTSIGIAIKSLTKLPKKYFNDKSNPKTVLICVSDGYDNLKDSAIQALSTGLKNLAIFLICNDSDGVLEGSREDLMSVGIRKLNVLFVKPSEEW